MPPRLIRHLQLQYRAATMTTRHYLKRVVVLETRMLRSSAVTQFALAEVMASRHLMTVTGIAWEMGMCGGVAR